jgi:hypothetical protein
VVCRDGTPAKFVGCTKSASGVEVVYKTPEGLIRFCAEDGLQEIREPWAIGLDLFMDTKEKSNEST